MKVWAAHTKQVREPISPSDLSADVAQAFEPSRRFQLVPIRCLPQTFNSYRNPEKRGWLMGSTVDTASFEALDEITGADFEDTQGLRELAGQASNYIRSFRWCPPIEQLLLAFGVGGALALFLVRFERPIGGVEDRELWIVVGDLPPAYFVTDGAVTRADALETYCELMEDWADRVLTKGDISESFPVAADPTIEHAEMLKGRLEFIREKLIPEA
jgi:hypothetical protein